MSEAIKLKRSVIKEELVAITGGYIEAILLNQLIYWTERTADFDKYIMQENERAKKEGQPTNDVTGGWIYKTSEDLADETMLGLSSASIRKYIIFLENMGYISERENPKHKWDRTKQYRVNMINVIQALTKKGYTLEGYKTNFQLLFSNLAFLEIENQSLKIENQSVKNSNAIPYTTPETPSETVCKKESKPNGYSEIIDSYTANEDLKEALWEFIKMRKLIKKPVTDRALKGIMSKLDTLASTDADKIAILDQSITNSWQGVYPLKQDNGGGNNGDTSGAEKFAFLDGTRL
jgi:hypothetical protein